MHAAVGQISPRDVLQARSWSHALFTTYSLSLSFVEAVPLPSLRTSQDLRILSDLEGYRSSLSDAGALGAGLSYEVTPIEAPGGVFHPKVSVLADKETAWVMVGSGNLTFGGWGRNLETLDVLLPGVDSTALGQVADFIEQLSDEVGPARRLKSDRDLDLGLYAHACRRAATSGEGGAAHFLHSLSASLSEQIAALASDMGGATALTIVSPFFSGHHGVSFLAQALNCSDVAVAVPALAPSLFDFAQARAAGFDARPVISDEFADTRSLHAKLFDIECRRGRLIVSGSGNASVPALDGRNVEAMVARVRDRTALIGWRVSGTYEGKATGEPEPNPANLPCLVARLDGVFIKGRVFGHGGVDETWSARLLAGSVSLPLGSPTMKGRSFIIELAGIDPISLRVSAQLVFERAIESVRGWLMLDSVLDAVREKGQVARNVIRILSGVESEDDIGGLLAFLAAHPEAMLGSTDYGSSQGSRRGSREDLPGRIIPLEQLTSNDALSLNPGGGSPSGQGGAFDPLMQVLLRHLEHQLPGRKEDDDEEEEEEGSKKKVAKSKERPPNPRSRVRNRGMKEALDSLLSRIAREPSGPNRHAGLRVVLNFILFVVPWADEPDDISGPYLKRWLLLAMEKRAEDHDAGLDPTVATLLTSWVIHGVKEPMDAHTNLQRWLGRVLDADDQESLRPDSSGFDAQRLASDANDETWKRAWLELSGSRTPWEAVSEFVSSLHTPAEIRMPASLTTSEVDRVKRFVRLGNCRDKIVHVIARDELRACPKCHSVLPHDPKKRLRENRIASCNCDRIIFDLAF